MFQKVFVFFILTLNVCVLGSRFVRTIITLDTTFGKVHGYVRDHYSIFAEIPYAKVNETNPFGNAKSLPHLEPFGEYSSLRVCPQHDKGVIIGDIQCLYLHVYKTNVITPGQALPVMVYIHGLEFSKGSASRLMFLPEYLLTHDVIVVTVDYRLGPYGYLCIPNTEYNNQALKDQILALRWVKNHIASFGGDPDNILLFGHGSGSISVEYLLLYSKDIIFNKVILQSGVASSAYWNEATDIDKFIKDVSADVENIDLYSFVKTISAINTHSVINITKFYDFRPCVDGEFITKTPNMRNLKNITLMIGGTTNEMLFFIKGRPEDFDFAKELNRSFSISKMPNSADAIDAVKHFYLENIKVHFVDFASDLGFNYPMERTVRYYVQNKCTVYKYLFTYDGLENYFKIKRNIKEAGSVHGDELGYLFNMRFSNSDSKKTKEDQVIIDRMSLMWTNFAKYGEPTPETSELLPVKWTPVILEQNRYLQIDTNLALHSGRPFEERMTFWDLYYEIYGMYAKGIYLGGEFIGNKACVVDLIKSSLLITVFLLSVCQ